MDKFLTLRGQESEKCNVICLPREREKEKNRDRSERDYKEYDSRPEVKERKKEWRADNPEKEFHFYHGRAGEHR